MRTSGFFISPKTVYIEQPDKFPPAMEAHYHDANDREWLGEFISKNLNLFGIEENDFYNEDGQINERVLLDLMKALNKERKFIEFAAWSAYFYEHLMCDSLKSAEYIREDIEDIVKNYRRYCLGGLLEFNLESKTFSFCNELIRDYYAARYVINCMYNTGYTDKHLDFHFTLKQDWDESICTLRNFIDEVTTTDKYTGIYKQLMLFKLSTVADLKNLRTILTAQGYQFDISKISDNEIQIALESSKNSALTEKMIVRVITCVEIAITSVSCFKDKLTIQVDEDSYSSLKISGSREIINSLYNMIFDCDRLHIDQKPERSVSLSP